MSGFPVVITGVRASAEELARAGAGIPSGPAWAEAVAVRLRRAGADVTIEPDATPFPTRRDVLTFCRERGEHSVSVIRADPTLLPELQVGSWFTGGWRTRLLRRLLLLSHLPTGWLPTPVAADAALWRGVRTRATAGEWRRLTTSYVVLCYHRVAGRPEPGQERWDVTPHAFRSQQRMLRLLGWRPLTPEEIESFHADPSRALPRRRYVLTADDGFAEAIAALASQGRCRPQAFVVTRAAGGAAEWFGDAQLAGWDELLLLHARGGIIGSHARRHLPLQTLDDAALERQVSGSLTDLSSRIRQPIPILAYPHGSHDVRVRAAAVKAGYAFAYTTQQGRNGAGTDRWCLRRVEPKIWDSPTSFWWKVLTGESPPPRWERRLERRWRRRSCFPAVTRSARAQLHSARDICDDIVIAPSPFAGRCKPSDHNYYIYPSRKNQ